MLLKITKIAITPRPRTERNFCFYTENENVSRSHKTCNLCELNSNENPFSTSRGTNTKNKNNNKYEKNKDINYKY